MFGHRHLDEITHQDVVTFHKAKRDSGFAPAYANNMVILLASMYNRAKTWGIPGAETNPAAGVPLFEANNARERFLSQEETQRLLAEVQKSDNPQLKYIVPLLLLLGARKRELLDARWQDFDLERRTWRIPMSKTGKAQACTAVAERPAAPGASAPMEGLPLRGAEPQDTPAVPVHLWVLGHCAEGSRDAGTADA